MLEPAEIKSKIPDNEENRKKCLCPSCPSYPQHCQEEMLFCGKKASKCDIHAQGCLCNACPVYFEFGLTGLYYCNQVENCKNHLLVRKKRCDEEPESYNTLIDIINMSLKQQRSLVSMGSVKKMPFSLDDIHFIPAQINKIPFNQEEHVNSEFILGPNAKKPLRLSSPILISGMSFGAVSKNVKKVIVEAAKNLKIGFNSGEGGLIDEEKSSGWEYRILQYATGRFGINKDLISQASAVEIRFGQGAYPGKGSYLPAEKMTSEVARVRSLKPGEGAYSPAHHPDILNKRNLEDKITWLRDITNGAPIGAKIGCGDVKKDVKALANVGVDFIALDGFGGGTGATDLYVRENVGIPIFAALPQAYETLKDMGLTDQISLIGSGGLRKSSDFAKCLALGASGIYIGTAALIAINCQQYRICNTGLCPTGITTQNPQLIKQLDVDDGVKRLINFIRISTDEIVNLTRIVGKNDINKLNRNDIVSLDKDLSKICRIRWLNGEFVK